MSQNLLSRATVATLELESKLGRGQFGFAAQALLALIMGKLGGNIQKINPSGHPDIVLEYLGRDTAIEVEVVGKDRITYDLTEADYAHAKPTSAREGYLAILDLHEPVRWHMIRIRSLIRPIVRQYGLSELLTVEDEQLTAACNSEYYDLVTKNAERITWLRFEGIRKRVLQGMFSLD